MRAKFITADGCWKYEQIPKFQPNYTFALIPPLKLLDHCTTDNCSMPAILVRIYEYSGKTENNVPVYTEVLD